MGYSPWGHTEPDTTERLRTLTSTYYTQIWGTVGWWHPSIDFRGLPYLSMGPAHTAGLLCAPEHRQGSPPLCEGRGSFPQHEGEALMGLEPQSTGQHLGSSHPVTVRLGEPISLTLISFSSEEAENQKTFWAHILSSEFTASLIVYLGVLIPNNFSAGV